MQLATRLWAGNIGLRGCFRASPTLASVVADVGPQADSSWSGSQKRCVTVSLTKMTATSKAEWALTWDCGDKHPGRDGHRLSYSRRGIIITRKGRDRLVGAGGEAIRKQVHPSEGHDSPLKAIKAGVYTFVAFL
eukprot:1162139-Pelagomonas_calceolata.AAC.1